MTEEQKLIAELQKQTEEKDARIAEMEGDILTTVETIVGVLQSFGIKPSDFAQKEGQKGDIMQKIGFILPKITMQFATGSFDGQAIQNVSALTVVFDKYKYLTENISLPDEQQG